VKESVIKAHESREHQQSMRIDRVLTGKYTAIPCFFGIMFLVFFLTFNVIGKWLSDLLSLGIDALTGIVDRGLTAYGINPIVHSMVIDGAFAGVGSVLSFLPIIVTLFFFLSILEDTGYMARIAFIMDRSLRKIGLSGRSFVPMLIGFGCSVPAIMSTRTLSSERDRKMSILLVPYMSCSAKDPDLCRVLRCLFSEDGSPDDDRTLYDGHRRRYRGGADPEKDQVPRESGSVRHGTAQLPFSFGEKRSPASVGESKRFPGKSLYDDLHSHHDHLVPADV
jgi:ferrous iron transport protein B